MVINFGVKKSGCGESVGLVPFSAFSRQRDPYRQTDSPRPLGISLYPAISGGRDIVLGDRFRTKLAYIPPLLITSVELGCKKT